MSMKKIIAGVMMLLFYFPVALAQSSGAPPTASEAFMQSLPMLLIFVAIFYFMLIRPQAKKQKEQRELLGSVKVGDEVVTSAGLMARISKISDDVVFLEINDQTLLKFKKSAISSILPKGTLKSID